MSEKQLPIKETTLAKQIKKAEKSGDIVIAFVYGEMGRGKTSYALWTAAGVLGSWDNVLDYLFFKPDDAINTFEKALSEGIRLPIVILDDFGLYLNRLSWWEPDKREFIEFFNMMRSVSSGIIMTSPADDVPRPILKKTNFRIKIEEIGNCDNFDEMAEYVSCQKASFIAQKYGLARIVSRARIYRAYLDTMMRSRVGLYGINYFPTWYPNDIYRKYEKIRSETMKAKLEQWKEKGSIQSFRQKPIAHRK